MSLSPLDSFQSRFVTYLLNCPRNSKTQNAAFVKHSLKCEQLSLPREAPRMNFGQGSTRRTIS